MRPGCTQALAYGPLKDREEQEWTETAEHHAEPEGNGFRSGLQLHGRPVRRIRIRAEVPALEPLHRFEEFLRVDDHTNLHESVLEVADDLDRVRVDLKRSGVQPELCPDRRPTQLEASQLESLRRPGPARSITRIEELDIEDIAVLKHLSNNSDPAASWLDE